MRQATSEWRRITGKYMRWVAIRPVPKSGRWTSEFTSRVHGLWSFAVRGTELTGTLVELPSGTVLRNVAVKRSGNPAGARDRD